MNKLSTQTYKGARDFYPEDMRLQNYIFGVWHKVARRFGYEQYDAPMIEPLELYTAKSGEELASEQTYTFEDRGGRQVAIRPEMTPSVSRMVAARRQELAYPLRYYSIPNLWRYERPQKGRFREHWQLNVDIFGVPTIDAELELIMIARDIMQSFGAAPATYKIRINSRKLVNFIMADYLGLDKTASRAMIKLLDRREKISKKEFDDQANAVHAGIAERVNALVDARTMADLPEEILKSSAIKEVQVLFTLLHEHGIKDAVFDISLVRGLDYYTDIVFEVFDADPENARAMFGGGRYDGLVGMFGVENLPVAGFGMGDAVIKDFLKTHKLLPKLESKTDLYVAVHGGELKEAQAIVKDLREMGLNVEIDITGRRLEKQIKTADKKSIKHVLFVGRKELNSGEFKLRNIVDGHEQTTTIDKVANLLKQNS